MDPFSEDAAEIQQRNMEKEYSFFMQWSNNVMQ